MIYGVTDASCHPYYRSMHPSRPVPILRWTLEASHTAWSHVLVTTGFLANSGDHFCRNCKPTHSYKDVHNNDSSFSFSNPTTMRWELIVTSSYLFLELKDTLNSIFISYFLKCYHNSYESLPARMLLMSLLNINALF